jgi:hypothetical protein
MSRTAISVCVIVGFSGMLVGTSQPKGDIRPDDAGSTPPAADAGDSGATRRAFPPRGGAQPHAVVPDSTDWPVVTIPRVGVAIRLPIGATVPVEPAGSEGRAPGQFTVVMKSGHRVDLRSGIPPMRIEDAKNRYRSAPPGAVEVLYEASDAVVAAILKPEPIGRVDEVTACGSARDIRLCVETARTEGHVDGDKLTTLSSDECLQVVAMLRSLEAAP